MTPLESGLKKEHNTQNGHLAKHKCMLGGEWLDSSPKEEDLGVSADERFDMSQ